MKANVFQKRRARADTEEVLREGVYRDEGWVEFVEAIADKNTAIAKKQRIREFHVSLRKEAIAKASGALSAPPGTLTPEQDMARVMHLLAPGIIAKFIGSKRAGVLYGDWKRDPARYRFFTEYLRGLAFGIWYAANERSQPIDTNAHVDMELLCALHCADAVVTDDTKFLRALFDRYWKPRGKRIYTAASLATYLELLR